MDLKIRWYWCVNVTILVLVVVLSHVGLSRWLRGKESTSNDGDARDMGLILGLGRSPGGGNGNPLQYSCLENLMDRGACRVL